MFGSLYLRSERDDICSGKAGVPVSLKHLSLSLSPLLCSQNTCVHVLVSRPQSVPRALLWLGWFTQAPLGSVHSHSQNSFLRTGRGKRTPEEESRLSFPPSFPLTSFWTWETSDSPPAKSLHSVQLSSLNDMATPFLPHHVHVDMAVILP